MNYLSTIKRVVINYFKGKKYFGYVQKKGRIFTPGEIKGYFNDFMHKTEWKGEEIDGIPIIDFGRKKSFMINVFQKALGHWDRYLIYKDKKDKEQFLNLCNFGIKEQDEKGGFKIWEQIGVQEFFSSPYSALCQGHAISCFLRAYILTKRMDFLKGCQKAFEILCTDIKKRGVLRKINKEIIILEEYPEENLNGVLNGWIYAIYGIYEYWIFNKEKPVYDFLRKNIESLKRLLPEYDSGFWSFYNLKKEIAPPFYHTLHIELLNSFFKIFPKEKTFKEYAEKFRKYNRKKTNFIRARLKGFYQRLKRPPKFVPLG